jgi:hypothetical protein
LVSVKVEDVLHPGSIALATRETAVLAVCTTNYVTALHLNTGRYHFLRHMVSPVVHSVSSTVLLRAQLCSFCPVVLGVLSFVTCSRVQTAAG